MYKFIILLTVLSVHFSHASPSRVRFLFDDREAIQARVDLIQQAQSEILVEYFSVWNDDQSVGGMALLVDAAKRGVKVKIILDALSNTVPLSLFGALMTKGIDANGQNNLEIKLYNPVTPNLFKMTHRNHAKMLIIDNSKILTGGRNVGDKYFGLNEERNFDDLDVIVDGDIVQDARANFYSVWNSKIVKDPSLFEYAPENVQINSCVGKNEDFDRCESMRVYAIKTMDEEIERIRFHMSEILKADLDDIVQNETGRDWLSDADLVSDIRFMSHQPDKLVSPETAYMTHDLFKMLSLAKKEVVIVSPYLIPTQNLKDALKGLMNRGIKVKFLTNSMNSTDNVFAQAGYRKHKKSLIKMGLEIYEYNGPNTLHAKTAVIDGHISLIGTYNVDPRSAFINREIGLGVYESTKSAPVAAKLLDLISLYEKKSYLVGKDRVEHNKQKEFEGISFKKRLSLRLVNIVLPLIEGQL